MKTSTITYGQDDFGLLEKTELIQNRPNPFSTETKIEMHLPQEVISAEIIIYDLQGVQLKTIPVNNRENTSISIQAYELEAGMYLFTLITDGKVIDTKRMILQR